MKITKFFWVGLIFMLSGFIFISGLLYIQDISLNKSNYVFTVLFDNVQGLNVGDQVDMLGKKIGRVSHTRIKGQKIAVVLSIDNSFAFSIPVDSKIEVKSEGLIGSKFISITPGLNRKDFILPGTTVEGLREFDFSEITPGIVPLTQDLSAFARQLKALLGPEEKDNISLTLKNIESFTGTLDSFIYQNKNIISESDKENIQNFIKNLNATVKDMKYGINKEIKKVDDILNNVKQVTDKSDEMSIAITEIKNSSIILVEIVNNLDNIINKINLSEGTLGKLVFNDSLYNNMNALVYELRDFVKDLKDNPSKYMKAYRKSKK